MPGTAETQMPVRIPYFLKDILVKQKTTPATTTKIYSIAAMYFDKLISEDQCNYFIKVFQDPKASEKLQSLKNLIDQIDREATTTLKRKKSLIQRKFITDSLKAFQKLSKLTPYEKQACGEMLQALEEV